MSDSYLGEIKIVSFNFPPKGWALCNGQLLPINQNQALFSILGTTYGGNGQTTFALPDLRGRTPFHTGNGLTLGQISGEENHLLTLNELPTHSHNVVATSATADQTSPASGFWAKTGNAIYAASTPNAAMASQAVGAVGANQAHPNMSPFTVLNFVIALQGIFPSRN